MGDSGPKPGPHVRFWPLGSHKCSCRVDSVRVGAGGSQQPLHNSLEAPSAYTHQERMWAPGQESRCAPLPQTHHCLLCLEQGRMRVLAYLCPRIGQGEGIGCQRSGIPLRVQGWEMEGAGGCPILSPVLCCNEARHLKPVLLPG